MKDAINHTLSQLHNDESGATATEYIILLVLVACFVMGIVKVFGATVSEKFDDANQGIMTNLVF